MNPLLQCDVAKLHVQDRMKEADASRVSRQIKGKRTSVLAQFKDTVQAWSSLLMKLNDQQDQDPCLPEKHLFFDTNT